MGPSQASIFCNLAVVPWSGLDRINKWIIVWWWALFDLKWFLLLQFWYHWRFYVLSCYCLHSNGDHDSLGKFSWASIILWRYSPAFKGLFFVSSTGPWNGRYHRLSVLLQVLLRSLTLVRCSASLHGCRDTWVPDHSFSLALVGCFLTVEWNIVIPWNHYLNPGRPGRSRSKEFRIHGAWMAQVLVQNSIPSASIRVAWWLQILIFTSAFLTTEMQRVSLISLWLFHFLQLT